MLCFFPSSVFRNPLESHLLKDQGEDPKGAKTRVPQKPLKRWASFRAGHLLTLPPTHQALAKDFTYLTFELEGFVNFNNISCRSAMRGSWKCEGSFSTFWERKHSSFYVPLSSSTSRIVCFGRSEASALWKQCLIIWILQPYICYTQTVKWRWVFC